MAEAVGANREERMGALLSAALLALGVVLFLLQMPAVLARTAHFTPWTYVPPILAFFVAVWQKADAVVQLVILWLSLFFIIDVVFGTGLFAG
jgi:hypothetical protein